MNKKLFFRILGALASALIIVSVFVPYVSSDGRTLSLWNSFGTVNSLYLPIMIITFGAIGVIFFALNIKTEFAYMSTGAILFFLVVQTVDIVNDGLFRTLNLGYYFLAVGAVLTGVMAFLTNLKIGKNRKNVEVSNTEDNQTSLLNKIDNLYNDQSLETVTLPMDTPINGIQPISVEPINNISSVQPIQPLETIQTNLVERNQPINPVINNPAVQEFSTPVQNQQPVNPVLQEFNSTINNSMVQDFSVDGQNQQPAVSTIQSQPIQTNLVDVNQQINLSLQEANKPVGSVISSQMPETVNLQDLNNNQPATNNPVLQEFTNPSSSIISQEKTNSNEFDIFGQPINK